MTIELFFPPSYCKKNCQGLKHILFYCLHTMFCTVNQSLSGQSDQNCELCSTFFEATSRATYDYDLLKFDKCYLRLPPKISGQSNQLLICCFWMKNKIGFGAQCFGQNFFELILHFTFGQRRHSQNLKIFKKGHLTANIP